MVEIILTGALSFLFGGGIISYLKFYQDTRKSDLTFIEEDLKRYKEAYEQLRLEIDKLKLTLLPSAVPEWRKDIKGRYVYVSPNYEIFILLPLNLSGEDVIGRTDEEIFHQYPEFVKELKLIDDQARHSLKKFAVKRDIKVPGQEGSLMIIKEITQNVDGVTYFVCRCYPEFKFN